MGIVLSSQQPKIAFEKYGVLEGLPEEFAFYQVQDQQGFIWSSTQNGLVKFDGYTMRVLKGNKDWEDIGIRNLNGGLLLDRNGRLWLAAVSRGGGLFSYDPKTENFTHYPNDQNDSTKVPFESCSLLFEDITGDIWFRSASDDGEQRFLCRIDPVTHRVSRYPHDPPFLSNPIVLNFKMSESRRDSSIWINTEEDSKLMRFNREKDHFELIFEKGDTLPGTELLDSIQDITPAGGSGLIPMGNNRRLYLWDPLKRQVAESYSFPTNKDSIWLGTAFEDRMGRIWHTSYGQVNRINRETSEIEKFTVGAGKLDFIKALTNVQSVIPEFQNEDFIIFAIAWRDNQNRGQRTWMRYDLKSGHFDFFDTQFNDPENEFVENNFGRKFSMDKTGLLWIGTRPNMYKQAPKSRQIAQFKHEDGNPESLHNDTIARFFQDSRGRLWVGTVNGIAIRNADNSFEQQFSGPGRSSKNSLGQIFKIYEDSNGLIWVATIGKGLYRWNETRTYFDRIVLGPGLDLIAGVWEGPEGNLWVSVWQRGIYIIDPNTGKVVRKFEPDKKDTHGLTSSTMIHLYRDSKGQMWLGDSRETEQGLYRYLPETGTFKSYSFDAVDTLTLSSSEITLITEDDRGRMWVGTDNGLNLYDREADHFLRNNDLYAIPSISSYARAGDGKMWFTTYSGDGLALVGPGVNDVEMFGEEKGLLHNDVSAQFGIEIPIDDAGKLWLPTDRGLSVFNPSTRSFTSYFEEDGLQPYSTFRTIYRSQNGDIWLGGNNGINHIVPATLAEKDHTPPSVVITRMGILDSVYAAADGVLFEMAVPYSEAVTLNHTQRDLSFEFVALHFLKPEDNLYSWKLENYDDNWTEPSKERRASYTNLSPGEYTFRVKGSNADGVWNEEGAQIRITIRPPWWQTGWAYAGYLVILGWIGFLFHRFQKQRTIRQERERSQAKELEQAREIEKAYEQLKATQEQLILSEKMASLGELTAGIAHEIQNPLNFVNNFSEVSSELVDEMNEELDKGAIQEAKAIGGDLKQNLEKINHHGRRADSIVKGMLQHSRGSEGKKEPTDINNLADEYLRLAYHGLRARDKSFNASMETDLDPKAGTLNVVPQDIGRVVLNLVTNAFYAVTDRAREAGAGYQPTVTLKTRKTGKGVEIEVTDNGMGIPEKNRSKIFQPFFTTKPSGKGTGLGLSMSYDIVTKGHGGELTMSSEEGKGTTFRVVLPQ